MSNSRLYVLFTVFVVCTYSEYSFTIETNGKVSTIPDEFCSFTLDSNLVSSSEYWQQLDFRNTLFNTLAKAITGSILRWGGTSQDMTQYVTSDNITYSSLASSQYTLNMTQFSEISDFSERNCFYLVFGLNAQNRKSDGSWDSSNAVQFLNKIMTSQNNPSLMAGFELGNEPDLYGDNNYNNDQFNTITPQQLAKDYNELYRIIQNMYINNTNNQRIPWIMGPDTADIKNDFDYLQSFIQNINPNIMDVITWHQYYDNNTGNFNDINTFYNVTILDEVIDSIDDAMKILNKVNVSRIILGETSSTPFGNVGTVNLSMSYIAGFSWLDKLGLASYAGIYSVVRQSIWGGNYGLIGNWNNGNNLDYKPNPDYWTSYLYKNLIGNVVLSMKDVSVFTKGRNVRVYSYCTRSKDQYGIFNYNRGSITVMILNLNDNSVDIELNSGNGKGDYYDKFILTPYKNVLNSRSIYLNDKLIEMVDDETMPQLIPEKVDYGSTIIIPGTSYGFVVIANADAVACL